MQEPDLETVLEDVLHMFMENNPIRKFCIYIYVE